MLNKQTTQRRTLILYPAEQLALDNGATALLIFDRPGLIPPAIGEQLVGRTAFEDGRLLEVEAVRDTTVDLLTDAEKDAVKATAERFMPWLIRMMGTVPWSPLSRVYLTTVKAVAW